MYRRNLLALTLTACSFSLVLAQEVDTPVRNIVGVEETWELTVGAPNHLNNAPQVTMAMSPTANADGEYFMFSMNYRSEPNYVPGGMQVTLWNGETRLGYRNGPKESQIDELNDTIRWKQRIYLHESKAIFEVVDGQSASWGQFGGEGYLKQAAEGSFANLNQYSPYHSMDESGINFAGNRVAALKLTQIKWYFSNGKSYTATAPFDIDSDELDPWVNEEDN